MAAFLAPVLAITGWHQSPAGGAILIAGMFAAVGVTAFIAHVFEGDVEAEVADWAARTTAPAGPLAPAH